MKKLLLILFLVCSPLIAQDAKVTFADDEATGRIFTGKEIQSLTSNILRVATIPFTGTTRMGSSMCWKAVLSWP